MQLCIGLQAKNHIRWTYKSIRLKQRKNFPLKFRDLELNPAMFAQPLYATTNISIRFIWGFREPAFCRQFLPIQIHVFIPINFGQGLEGMAQRSGSRLYFNRTDLEPILKPLIEKPGSTIKAVYFPLEWDLNEDVDPQMRCRSRSDFIFH